MAEPTAFWRDRAKTFANPQFPFATQANPIIWQQRKIGQFDRTSNASSAGCSSLARRGDSRWQAARCVPDMGAIRRLNCGRAACSPRFAWNLLASETDSNEEEE